MSQRYYMRKGDRLPILEVQLEGDDGPVDLTGATVEMKYGLPDGTPVTRAVAITDPTRGIVQYEWIEADTATADVFLLWFIADFGGKLQTFPQIGYYALI